MTPAALLAHKCPDILGQLSPAELAYALHEVEIWLRSDQLVPPPGSWRSFTFVAGRGSGKSFGLCYDLNRGVERGFIRKPTLVGPSLDEVHDKQVKPLTEHSPPWFKAQEHRSGVLWPNGVWASPRTAQVDRPASGDNFDYAWLTELVKWPESTRRSAFNDITTACRVGRHPRYVIDTTSAGVNELILLLRDQHRQHPETHLMRRGTIFDNPHLTLEYVVSEIHKYGWGTRSADEELLGLVFDQTAGALWRAEWLRNTRRNIRPLQRKQCLLAWDPAQSDAHTADEQGLAKGDLGLDGHVYLVEDFSGRMTPGAAADALVEQCEIDATGIIIETNKMGQMPRQLIEASARARNLRIVLLKRDEQFPPRRHGTAYVKEYHTNETKEHRATPAAQLYRQGRAHHVGTHVELEREQTSWEPGARRSPNRLDACAYVISELGGLATPAEDGTAAVRDAADAQQELQRMIAKRRRRGSGRARRGV